MAARAIWKGVLQLDGASIPVKLYSAVQERTIHFHLLDAKTLSPVKQRMVDPETGKEVPSEKIRKGYEVEPDTFVVLEEEELRRTEPAPSRDIEVTRFLPPGLILHQLYDRPYYLAPDGDDTGYAALSEALEHSRREGLARWVMRNKQYRGALLSKDGYLWLITLRPAEEILTARDLPSPSGRPLDPKEIQMAQQLISVLQDEFRPNDFHDEYRERVLSLIDAKAKGRKPKLEPITARRQPKSLVDALSASIQSAKGRKGKAVA
jgi:DNA end-binding protein Ku